MSELTPASAIPKLDEGLLEYLGCAYRQSWARSQLSDQELVYYLSSPKRIVSRLGWVAVSDAPTPKQPRARLSALVHCCEQDARSLRLYGRITHSGYSISLVYPARPAGIRLAGVDSAESVDLNNDVVDGPHAQLWSETSGRIDRHSRIMHCEPACIPSAVQEVHVVMLRFLQATNIELKYPLQAQWHLSYDQGGAPE